jgi:thioredoxin 1
MLHVTDATFQKEVLEADLPVMVDVWAEWCGPCHAIAPVVEAIAEQYEGRARVVKLNSDDNRATAQKYNILGIPTLLFFLDGELVDRTVGVQPMQAIVYRLKRLMIKSGSQVESAPREPLIRLPRKATEWFALVMLIAMLVGIVTRLFR